MRPSSDVVTNQRPASMHQGYARLAQVGRRDNDITYPWCHSACVAM